MEDSESDEISRVAPEAIAGRWLRRRIISEALVQIVEAGTFGVLGLISTALVTGVVVMVLFLALSDTRAFDTAASIALISAAAFVGVLFVSYLLPQSRLDGLDADGGWTDLRLPLLFGVIGAFASVGFEIVSAGARFLRKSGDSAASAARLLRLDIPQIAPIIVWLLARGTKASVREVSFQFDEINAVRILPQMRDIPGVIWLPDPRGILLLSEDFRNELRKIVPHGTYANPWNAPPPEGAEEEDTFVPDENEEVLGWYKTLGLPPFVPIHTVKQKYRRLAKIYHPDAFQGGDTDRVNPDEAMKQINEAYHNILKSDQARH